MLLATAQHPVTVDWQSFWTEKSLSRHQDSNPACPDRIPSLYLLCHHHCHLSPDLNRNVSFQAKRRRPNTTSSTTSSCMSTHPKLKILSSLKFVRSALLFFSTSLLPTFHCQIFFLPLISVLTGFHNWGLVTRWAQLLITSTYYLPSTPKDQSRMRAELTRVVRSA